MLPIVPSGSDSGTQWPNSILTVPGGGRQTGIFDLTSGNWARSASQSRS